MKTTPYERRFGDDCRSSWSRLLRPRINLGRDLGGVCDVYWAEIKTIKERKHIMKKNERQIIIEEVARIALEDKDYREYVAHELDLSDEEMEKTYSYLVKLLKAE